MIDKEKKVEELKQEILTLIKNYEKEQNQTISVDISYTTDGEYYFYVD